MLKILFLIHDLGQGGAEKVLVNLVNNMDKSKFDITVMSLFGGGVNEQFLAPHIRYITCFKKVIRGNSHIMKLFSPKQLHKWFIKEHYDIEVAYLEGPPARIVSGCTDPTTKKVAWVHCTMNDESDIAIGFRNFAEAMECYTRFDSMTFVSENVMTSFIAVCPLTCKTNVLYNTNDTPRILKLMHDFIDDTFRTDEINLIAMGKIVPLKGFDRLARITKRLREDGIPVHTYILGIGPQKDEIEAYIRENNLSDAYTFLGYKTNPYKYVSKADLFVCSSHAEGFSTAATEALIVGTPVCTVEVSGMKEMLGEHNEYGVVTENNEDALYEGIHNMLTTPGMLEHYKKQAEIRGEMFSTTETVRAVEEMLEDLVE